MAAHYGTVVIPARPRRPRDKAKVESGVQVVERWILARLRNRTFFSLGELNEAIWGELEVLNQKPFQKLEGSRRSLFEKLDRPALKPLPAQRYEFAQWKKARVNLDYHIEADHNYYSVPHAYIHKEVEVRLTVGAVEILYGGQRIASHRRCYGRGHFSTEVAHMPKAHQKHLDRTPSRLIEEAKAIGPGTAALVKAILEDRPHPEQGYRSCLGILRLAKHYQKERMEAAAKRALQSGVRSYRRLQSILDHGLDRVPLEPRPQLPPASHANVRGPEYFSKEGASQC
jgi:transposase